MEGFTRAENDLQGGFVEAIAQQGSHDHLDQDSSPATDKNHGDEDERIRELARALAFEKRRAASYKRYLTVVIGYIEEYNERASKTMSKASEIVEHIEAIELESP